MKCSRGLVWKQLSLLNENSKEPTIQTSLWSAISGGRDLVIETRHWLRNALEKFARNRAEHCTYDALLKMYKRVFEAFVESGNAIKLEEAEHVDKNGNRVEDETKAFSSMSRS